MAADDDAVRVRMSADVDAPDKVVYGLTFHQLAVLAVAGVLFAGAWHALHRLVPSAVLLGGGGILAVVTFGLVVGRRDGLPLDRWLIHGLRFTRTPRARTTINAAVTVPTWVTPPPARMPLPAPLALPATAIGDDGQISLGDAATAIVAATTVNLALRTGEEQTALVETFGRWLNSLTRPTQIVVSAQPVDLHAHADIVAARAAAMPHPALADACADHGAFLADLAHRRDPLRRLVLIATRTARDGGPRRHADDTVRALAALGITGRALDGSAATAALAGCADPYRPPRSGGLAPPDTVITAPPATVRRPAT